MRFEFICILFLSCSISFAQNQEEFIQDWMNELSIESEELNYEYLIVELEEYLNHPLNLNKASKEKLESSPFFNSRQANTILEYRAEHGDILSMYELLQMDFDAKTINRLKPFVVVDRKVQTFKAVNELTTFSRIKLPVPAGYSKFNGYVGSPIALSTRYRYQNEKGIQFGMNVEKDLGEKLISSRTSLIDYVGIYGVVHHQKTTIYLGRFHANFGQGLCLGTGYAAAKSGIVTCSKRVTNGFDAYRSFGENNGLNGFALSHKLKRIRLDAFISYQKLDATVNDDYQSIRRLIEGGGYHRTESELNQHNTARSKQLGVNFSYNNSSYHIGMVANWRTFNLPILPSIELHNQDVFRGKSYLKISSYFDKAWRNVNFYGELTSHKLGSYSFCSGALISLGQHLDICSVIRRYSADNVTYQSNGFGENSKNTNEQGWYNGFQLKVNRIQISGFIDLYRFDKIKYSIPAPSFGNDTWLEVGYKASKNLSLQFRRRDEWTISKVTGSVQPRTKNANRLHLNYWINQNLQIRSRIEWNKLIAANMSQGSVIYSEVIYRPARVVQAVSLRISNGVVDQWDNRIYSFERVPLYNYPLHAHGFTGMRTYVLVQYSLFKKLKVWTKLSISQHAQNLKSLDNNVSIGSGNEKINGNIKKDFTLQLKYSFE